MDSQLGNNPDVDRLIMSRLGPWDSARLGCVCRNLRSLELDNPQHNRHWLLEMEGESRLWMINLVTAQQRWVDINIPPCCTRESALEHRPDYKYPKVPPSSHALVLCSFQGRLLIRLCDTHGGRLILGDPLGSSDQGWQVLPPLSFPVHGAAFCPLDGTLLVTDYLPRTATLAAGATAWDTDRPLSRREFQDSDMGDIFGRVVWGGDDAFYAQFEMEHFPDTEVSEPGWTLARYELKGRRRRRQRRWREVRLDQGDSEAMVCRYPAELGGKLAMFLESSYCVELDPDWSGLHQVASETAEHGMKLERVPLLGQSVEWAVEGASEEGYHFYGDEEFLVWDYFDGQVLVYSVRDQQLRKLPCGECNGVPPKCYHRATK